LGEAPIVDISLIVIIIGIILFILDVIDHAFNLELAKKRE